MAKPKRPADVIGNAVKVMRIAVGEDADDAPTDDGKNKAARELGRLRANVDVRITAITTNNGECGNDRVYLGVPQSEGTFEQLLAGEPSSRYGAAQLLPILPLALKQGMLFVLTLHCPLREIRLNTDQGTATFSAE